MQPTFLIGFASLPLDFSMPGWLIIRSKLRKFVNIRVFVCFCLIILVKLDEVTDFVLKRI